MTDFSYDYVARHLNKLGFQNLKQVDESIRNYDDDKISRVIWGGIRQGQLRRFEDTILAALGEEIIKRHPYCINTESNYEFWIEAFKRRLALLNKAGIDTGKYKLLNPKE